MPPAAADDPFRRREPPGGGAGRGWVRARSIDNKIVPVLFSALIFAALHCLRMKRCAGMSLSDSPSSPRVPILRQCDDFWDQLRSGKHWCAYCVTTITNIQWERKAGTKKWWINLAISLVTKLKIYLGN
ncbi:hypothetical protein EVAR_35738_1 [Eumeta japonica]|uniref:Uncharacterized protein n=1 Tax=Eumeta variegata TaxID=151549 RepID=A0A4C1VH74_EUMVA|nr:hypothetical protein EVAR_35738_1 [Eumeta japonica]